MSLRAKIVVYLVAIHVILGAVTAFTLVGRPWWMLIVCEVLFALSAAFGYRLVRAFFVPLDLIRTGTELLREREFTTHFREVGQTEMDALIGIYNRMVDRLREERLKHEERNLFLGRLLAASPTGVVTLDHDGKVSQVNPGAERLLAQPESALIGRALEPSAGPVIGAMSALGRDQATLVSPDGRRRLRCRRTEFFDRGFPRAFFLIEELTDELRASEKAAYSKVIRMMSHEVNNSVGAVRSLLESFHAYEHQLAQDDRADYVGALDVASGRLQRLSAFMNGLASVARVPAPDCRPCDLTTLLRDLVRLLGPELERREIAVDWQLARDFPEARLDKNQIEQVLVNVFRNAIEAIESKGRIQVETGSVDRQRFVSIRDSGTGVPAAVRPMLFTPFFSTKRDGQGIGLTLVQEILTQHGFEYSLATHPGGGAEFRIVL